MGWTHYYIKPICKLKMSTKWIHISETNFFIFFYLQITRPKTFIFNEIWILQFKQFQGHNLEKKGVITYNGIKDFPTTFGHVIVSRVIRFRNKYILNMKNVMNFIIPYYV